MDNYIKAVEEIGFVKYINSGEIVRFHQKGVKLSLQNNVTDHYFDDAVAINTSKRRYGTLTTKKEFLIFSVTESQLPLAIRAIVRFWAKNGVKLGKEKK
jgi:hypothetical protein